jgi:formylglycine-generating enzyme required for sulfatase activity
VAWSRPRPARSSLGAAQPAPERAAIPGGTFDTILPPAEKLKVATVRPFRMDRRTVSNADFARFVGEHAEWRRDRIAHVFADASYLKHWQSPAAPGAGIEAQPVTQVSWFAAKAYCEARNARLPTWYEWEFVSAASASCAGCARGSAVAPGHPRLVCTPRRPSRCRRPAAPHLTSMAYATCTAWCGSGCWISAR